MRRLPLFPLPLVLFPGAPIPLHVFEPRYRQMMARCIEGDGEFGIVYHDPDLHGPFAADEGAVGCVAKILKFQPLPDGRSLVLSRGAGRFRIADGIESGLPYHEALVAPYEDDPVTPSGGPRLLARRRRSIGLFYRLLGEVIQYRQPYPELDPRVETGFQIAQAVRTDPTWQQRLLEMCDERDRLSQVDELLLALISAGPSGWKRVQDL
jgi:ATP-dependent Lon protease